MAQQGRGGQPHLFYDQARKLRFYHDTRTDEYVYENGLRLPVPRQSTVPRTTPNLQQLGSDQPGPAHSNRPQAATSPTREPRYAHAPPQEPGNVDSIERQVAGMSIGTPAGLSTRQYNHHGIRVTEAQNSQSQVRTIVGTYPPNLITDPAFYQAGISAQSLLIGTGDAPVENLYPRFRLQSKGFFKVGRVFLVLWAEPAGETGASVISKFETSDPALSTGAHNEKVHSKVRRFVVIREGENYCSALPISTYSGQGVGKASVNKSEHAIIHTTREAPTARSFEQPTRKDEGGMRPLPIRVVPDDPGESLDPMSRIDFGKIHTVQHNLKVRPLGNVHPGSQNALHTQFSNVWSKTTTIGGGTAIAVPLASRARTSVGGKAPSDKSSARRSGKVPQRPGREHSDQDDSDEGDEDDSEDEGAQLPSWSTRAQQARDAFARLLQQGITQEQAVAQMAHRLQRQRGMSQPAAAAEIRSLLSGGQQ